MPADGTPSPPFRVTVGGNVVEALQTSALVTVSSDLADPSAITASGVEWKVGNETFRKVPAG